MATEVSKPENTIRVALLAGGDSSEREISLKTAMSMHGAISPQRFDVTVFDVSSRAQCAALHIDAARVSPDEYSTLESWWNEESPGKRRFIHWNALATELKPQHFDVVLSGLHGGWGEDGTIQALLEVAGISYVGSPQRSSVIAIDKQLCKLVMREAGLNVAQGVFVGDVIPEPPFPGPIAVKPNAGGSSVGVTLFRQGCNAAQWQDAICAALADGSGALVEELIEGVEVNAGVLGEGQSARALPLIEIVPHSASGFYDYEAKYAAGGSEHLIPPRLPQETLDRVADYALRAHRVLGCRGVSRSDYIVTPDGTPYFLEINTLPGMTKTSLVPDAARAAGISFEQLIETLLWEALQRTH
ncbi:MAG TPA: D-alanine--D-alanine ligase [Abditibacteriaceae bacterium]